MAVIIRQGKVFKPQNISVLAVDDQPFFRTIMIEVLRALGIQDIHMAESGEEALDLLPDARPSLILSDWVMPEMDGLEFTKKVRRNTHDHLRTLPIILVTANNKADEITRARQAGVDNFILKPISAKAVYSRMKEVIERPKPFVAAMDYIGPCRRRGEREGYRGPYRRFDDPMEVGETPAERVTRLVKTFRQLLERLNILSRALAQGNLDALEPILATIRAIEINAQEMDDPHMKGAAAALDHYFTQLPDIYSARPDVIQTHIEAIDVIMRTPKSMNGARASVVDGLQKAVQKALKAA